MKTYQYLENIKRENTSHRIFPNVNIGDVLIHNYSVWHGVAPLISGTRYAISFFYDMDNYAHNLEKKGKAK